MFISVRYLTTTAHRVKYKIGSSKAIDICNSSTGALGGGHLGHMSNVPYFYLYSFNVNSKIVPCGMSN